MLGGVKRSGAGAVAALLAPAWGLAADVPLPAFDCAGILGSQASHAALARHFGPRNVVFATVPAAEGTTAQATVLFRGDRERRAEIEWRDMARRRAPASVTVGEGSRWQTPEGIGVGARLEEVEAANGGPFILAGFGWDYAGTVYDWEGGRLARTGCRLILRFEPAAGMGEGLDGDRDFRSDSPAMRAARPVVREMLLLWD
ncbi:hypothetical protein ACI7BZ_01515 [Xanthobacter sp. AM11]|uniref:hypothetical protein n=1 Tax=Xanthobacter sp. AM11 TaxID=3380643 RepID=UPI0039BF1F16